MVEHLNRQRVLNLLDSHYSGDIESALARLSDDIDYIAVLIRAFFRKSGSDRVVQFDIAVFFTFRDGLITQIRELIDSFDLVQQVLERDVAAVLAETKPNKT